MAAQVNRAWFDHQLAGLDPFDKAATLSIPSSFTRLTKGPLPDLIGSVTGEFVGSSGPAGEGPDQR